MENKYLECSMYAYNLFNYHRYLASMNNSNLVDNNFGQSQSSSSLLFEMNLFTYFNMPQILSNLSITPAISNSFVLPIQRTTNLMQSNVNRSCRCKCRCGGDERISTNNDENNQSMSSGLISTDESVLSSFESSADETLLSYPIDNQIIRAESPETLLTTAKVPRAIRKLNVPIFQKKSTIPPNDTKQVHINTLLPELLDRKEKVLMKYRNGLSSEARKKIFDRKKSTVHQRPVAVQPKEQICYFCKKNGEPDYLYKAHIVRDPVTNKTLCPVLRKYKCELCQASGDEAHTRSYCRLSKFIRQNCENVEAAKYFNMKVLTSQHRKKQNNHVKFEKHSNRCYGQSVRE